MHCIQQLATRTKALKIKLTNTTKSMKYLLISLTRNQHKLYTKNYKILQKGTKNTE